MGTDIVKDEDNPMLLKKEDRKSDVLSPSISSPLTPEELQSFQPSKKKFDFSKFPFYAKFVKRKKLGIEIGWKWWF